MRERRQTDTMQTVRIIILDGKDRNNLKQVLAARVEEFFNKNHDEKGRFAPSSSGQIRLREVRS